MVLFVSILPFCLNVYAETSGVDWTEAYIYDVLQDQMVSETPFVGSTRKDVLWAIDALNIGLIAGGVELAGTGGFGSSVVTSSAGLKLKDFFDKAKGINDGLETPDNDILGHVKYYKGEPYYCDTKNCRFFRLTDSMKRELSEMDKEHLIGQFFPDSNEYQRQVLAGRLSNNTLNTLLYYTGETGQALSDLISMYKGRINHNDDYRDGLDTATTVYCMHFYYRGEDRFATVPRWFNFNGVSYPYIICRRGGDVSYGVNFGGAFYGKIVHENAFWLVCNTSTDSIIANSFSPYWYKNYIDISQDELLLITNNYRGIKIGGYGVDNEPFTTLPFTFPGRSLSPGLYDAGTVSDDFVKPIKDFINDEFDDNMPGYADGADDDGHVPDYRDDAVPVSYNSVPTPTILPIDLPLVPPDDPGDDPDDPGNDRPEYPSDNPVQPGEPMNVPSVSWNGMELDIDDIYIPDFTNAFPFCIPFDIINGIRGFTSQEQLPIWTIPVKFSLNGQSIVDTSIVIDLTQWEMGLFWPILRGCLLIIFIIGLCIFTIKLIK